MEKKKQRIETTCVQGGYHPGNGEPRQIPIIQSTTFKYNTGEDMGKLFDLEASALAGNGLWKDPGKNGQVSASRPAPLADDWLRNMDYYLTRRVGLGGTLTGHIGASLYAQLHFYWYHALDVTLLPGNDREIATLKVGYTF